jgi:ribosomal protein S18 acetylase RimI-like enzyme
MSELSLRPPRPEDQPFLLQLFRSSRPELAMLPESLVSVQFRGQTLSYDAQFPHADYQIVLLNEQPVGRLVVDRSAERIHLIDIALLPEGRGNGIGTTLLQGLQGEAARASLPLRLSVYEANPARRLYERLGFTVTGSQPPYLFMEWTPNTGGTACST